MDLIPINNS